MHLPTNAIIRGEDIELSIDVALLSYEEKDFRAAYDCLSSVLDIDPWNLEARELRAMTSKHLDAPLNNCQSDTEFLIEADPHRARPYLLLIECLLARGHFRDAVVLSRTASFRVYHTDPDFGELRALSERLRRTEIHFLVELPVEVICEIFSLLPFKVRLACISVSKRWRSILTNIPDLWSTIPVGMASKKDSVILALKNFSTWSKVQKLIVPACSRIFGALAQYRFCHIKKLDITHAADPLDPMIVFLVMKEIGQTWQEVFFTSNVPIRLFFAAAARFCPNLIKVTIANHFAPFGWIDIEKETLMELGGMLDLIGTVPIKTLVLDKCEIDLPTQEDIFSRCTSLQEVVLTFCDQCLSRQKIFRSMLALPALQSLAIHHDNCRYYIFRLNDDLSDLCTLLEKKTPAVLNLEEILTYREAMEKIHGAMRCGHLKRYGRKFRMDDDDDRSLLKRESLLEPIIENDIPMSEDEEQQSYDGDEVEQYADEVYQYFIDDYDHEVFEDNASYSYYI